MRKDLQCASFKIAEVELVYKTKVKAADRPQIFSAADAYNIFYSFWNKNKLELQEQFVIMLLNKNHRVLGMCEVSSGTTSQIVVDAKLIFSTALKAHASAIILAHNHPSGELLPSKDDIALTEKIKQAGNFLDITVMDHLIITIDGYYSFADYQLL